ncbi:helix-turn-helix transcriptional regulator [Streptomyces sp. S6]
MEIIMPVVRVAVHAEDALTFLGLVGSLAETPGLALVSSATGEEADVTVVSGQRVGLAFTELLKSLSEPVSGFLVISDNTGGTDYSETIGLGVRAVLRREEFTRQRLVETICLVVEGQACFPPELQGSLLDRMSRTRKGLGLSDREIAVLRMAAEGHSNIEIAKQLPYSERTIKNVFHCLMKRMQLRNRTHVVSYAIRAGLI